MEKICPFKGLKNREYMSLGKLKKVDLRKAWVHEAHDFTSWLSQEDNLAILSEEIAIDIKLIQTEAGVGNFNVDILAEEENTGRKIIIENQLEPTNHDHLGKIITYASGHEAGIVIWIVSDVREEHRRAIDWLNEHTDEDVNFFLVKMELWQIEGSPPAPKFQIESKPNDWAKIIKKSSSQSRLTEGKLLQLNFWNGFKEYAKAKNTKLKLRNASPQHWYDISLGSADAHISLSVNIRQDLIACEIYISDSKELYKFLEKYKKEIEKEIGYKLGWMELPGKKASRIKIMRDGSIEDKENWSESFSWLLAEAELFQKVFSRYIKKFR